ncbi:hypothetical protein A3759_17820 [Thalassolituus sp. HI0120]|nr:hypothetical protein A3759_17820 [Thalassolituus sp. HI0120]
MKNDFDINGFMYPPWLAFPMTKRFSGIWDRLGNGYMKRYKNFFVAMSEPERSCYEKLYEEPNSWSGFYIFLLEESMGKFNYLEGLKKAKIDSFSLTEKMFKDALEAKGNGNRIKYISLLEEIKYCHSFYSLEIATYIDRNINI